ncbi:hypothetical protein H2204_013983 [Knufia peltigerae]|uniref:Uncharacterized protein n=1 Tax=Knufia peltigerae TaxID=1002370 RepID=A0AA38XME8_9EURO|nr:hypothetical protein H2204_013983 [Knufia peltigerae]
MTFNSLRDQVIAVTGGSSGIGLSIVKKLLIIGAKVAIADLNAPAAGAIDGVGKLDADFTYTKVDVSQRNEVHKWIESTVQTFGRLDGMVPNAGVCPDEENYYDDDRIQLQLKVNVMGVWICATEAFKQFKKQNTPGSIVITASSQGLRGGPSNPGYAASKHAVVGMMKSLAVDWTPQGVRINAVAPGEKPPMFTDRG